VSGYPAAVVWGQDATVEGIVTVTNSREEADAIDAVPHDRFFAVHPLDRIVITS
jgi:hypothetical protein